MPPATARNGARTAADSPLVFDREACIGCGACAKRCAAKAISMVNKRPNVDGDGCTRCGECVKKCVRGAISFDRGSLPPKEAG